MMMALSGVIGFFLGFMAGQMILFLLLRDRSREEIIMNKELHRKYGPIGWASALLGTLAGIIINRHWVDWGLDAFFQSIGPVN